jgi:DnaA-homolog protein
MTQQLLLDLVPPPVPTFDNFVAGANTEAVAAVRRAIDAANVDFASRFVYLWGDAGSGRSHLLRAACDVAGGVFVSGTDAAVAIRAAVAANTPLLAVDDVDALDPAAQEALFHAYNALRGSEHGVLLASGPAQPRDLALDAARDDLRSRLAWGLVYRLERLEDGEKDAALAGHARQRGFPLAPDVRRYLLTHHARDLGSLMQLVDTLDRHARERRRVITLPMIREILEPEFPSAAA